MEEDKSECTPHHLLAVPFSFRTLMSKKYREKMRKSMQMKLGSEENPANGSDEETMTADDEGRADTRKTSRTQAEEGKTKSDNYRFTFTGERFPSLALRVRSH